MDATPTQPQPGPSHGERPFRRAKSNPLASPVAGASNQMAMLAATLAEMPVMKRMMGLLKPHVLALAALHVCWVATAVMGGGWRRVGVAGFGLVVATVHAFEMLPMQQFAGAGSFGLTGFLRILRHKVPSALQQQPPEPGAPAPSPDDVERVSAGVLSEPGAGTKAGLAHLLLGAVGGTALQWSSSVSAQSSASPSHVLSACAWVAWLTAGWLLRLRSHSGQRQPNSRELTNCRRTAYVHILYHWIVWCWAAVLITWVVLGAFTPSQDGLGLLQALCSLTLAVLAGVSLIAGYVACVSMCPCHNGLLADPTSAFGSWEFVSCGWLLVFTLAHVVLELAVVGQGLSTALMLELGTCLLVTCESFEVHHPHGALKPISTFEFDPREMLTQTLTNLSWRDGLTHGVPVVIWLAVCTFPFNLGWVYLVHLGALVAIGGMAARAVTTSLLQSPGIASLASMSGLLPMMWPQ